MTWSGMDVQMDVLVQLYKNIINGFGKDKGNLFYILEKLCICSLFTWFICKRTEKNGEVHLKRFLF